MQLIDLRHLGRERVIGSWLVGEVLIDPGPQSCMETLLSGLQGAEPRVIALTHIHLDHAGATGALLRRFPDAEVWVHERGARHLADPAKLLASAGRLYGDQMDRLWGEVLPVDEQRIRILSGGERLEGFEVAHTPGHAPHHVSYLHLDTATAFCGDVAGVRVGEGSRAIAPTPPPGIDPPVWRRSLDAIEAWSPQAIVPTHFGLYRDVADHLAQVRDSLDMLESLARRGEAKFLQGLREAIAAGGPDTIAVYEQAMPPEQTFAGMKRYLERS